MFGQRLAVLDLLATAAFTFFVYKALQCRRRVDLHAGYMLATAFMLVSPVLSRLLPMFVPGLTIRSVEQLTRFAIALHLAQLFSLILAAGLFQRHRRSGAPFLAVIGVLLAQTLAFETVGRSRWWSDISQAIGSAYPASLAATGLAAGTIVVYFGWMRRRAPYE